MYRVLNTLVFLIIIIHITICSSAQSPVYSENLIKYDLATHKTDKPIPFDRSFTLVIEKLSSKNIASIQAYEAEFKNGERLLLSNTYQDCNGARRTNYIKDVDLNWSQLSDTLQIFFPPLKPNTDFDVNIRYTLFPDCKTLLMNANIKLAEGDPTKANDTFDKAFICTYNPIFYRTSFAADFTEYQAFYTTALNSHYNNIGTLSNFSYTGFLTLSQIIAIDSVTSKNVSDFKDGSYLLEIFKQGLFSDLQLGLIRIDKLFTQDIITPCSIYDAEARLKNYESNRIYFDTLLKRTDRALSKGITNVSIGEYIVDIDTARIDIAAIRSNIQEGYKFLSAETNAVTASIDTNNRIKQGFFLVGNTVAGDLKTAGGNILFVDAGFTNILAPDLSGRAVYIPKLYTGVSIYFRPIDKNTRRQKFSRKFSPQENDGCKINSDGTNVYGPDYGIVTKRSLWQNLSLNIGITLGKMSNTDFDNFYNDNSLLIGPAYRFARAFKVSSGLALLKRSSKNPLQADKSVIPAAYLSLSVDVDFIQTIKDVTSIFFK